jgi:saccharopine dehydrogenase-like NADP-dependent oxidoreductase
MKTVLCLGAGLVARPYVHYLCEHGFHVVIASRTMDKIEHVIQGSDNAEPVKFDIKTDDQLLNQLTSRADIVCSLLPYIHHVKAARVAIRHRKPFCTTSYISDEMKTLDREARDAGIVILNECGVDPGIDHMSAMKIINQVHKKAGKILSFTSFTGGLPAPEANNNPFGYKLSWSPRGVLLAGRNDAHFLRNGEEVIILGRDLFDNYEIMEIPGAGRFEGYPNRDSISYIDIYGIRETRIMLRGTLRNTGWCSTLKKIADLGLLDIEERFLEGLTYSSLMRQLVSAGESNLIDAVASTTKLTPTDPIISRLQWLGLFADKKIPTGTTTRLDALCHLFEEKMQYAPGERDMLVMHHEFTVKYSSRKEKITSTLIDYGIPNGDSSMSRTVTIPVAIATRMILEGKLSLTGVIRPTMPELYEPILNELQTQGIRFNEDTQRL